MRLEDARGAQFGLLDEFRGGDLGGPLVARPERDADEPPTDVVLDPVRAPRALRAVGELLRASEEPHRSPRVNLGNFSSITTLGNFTKDLSNIKEEVRFVYTIAATNDWEGFLVNMTAPAWRPYA